MVHVDMYRLLDHARTDLLGELDSLDLDTDLDDAVVVVEWGEGIVERLSDTPAIVLSRFGETLLQNQSAVALLGDYTRFSGMSRYLVYRWFTDPAQRALYPPEDHALRGRVFTVEIRAAYTADPTGTAGEIVDALLAVSPEFAEVWRQHEVDVTHHDDLKRYRHPELGELELYARRLVDPDEGQELLVFLAEPGSPSGEKLQRLITMS
jgi:hypothetical protein